MQLQFIDTADEFSNYCDRIQSEQLFAFDTEFVAEDSYRPELCLLQIATRETVAIVDTLAIPSVDRFWKIVTDPTKDVIVHAGREELLFCFRAIEETIPNLFDIQIAAAFVGMDYPASYGNLVLKYAGKQLNKEETRSDWRNRPLTRQQLDYAAQDVTFLPSIFDKLCKKLKANSRFDWAIEEMRSRQGSLIEIEKSEQWTRVSGVQNLNPSAMPIARGLWRWRENRAQQRDMPPRRVLRDDLLVELARRGSSDKRRISTLRGMNHRHLKPLIDDLAKVISESRNQKVDLNLKRKRPSGPQPSSMLTQLMNAAVSQICRNNRLAPSIVSTTEDLKNFAMYALRGQHGNSSGESNGVSKPKLLQGWRKQLVADPLNDLLSGRVGLMIDNPLDDIPIQFCRAERIDPPEIDDFTAEVMDDE